MAKIRIYELAKELGIEDNKELVAYVRGLGIEIKGVMSTLDDDQAETGQRREYRQARAKNNLSAALPGLHKALRAGRLAECRM